MRQHSLPRWGRPPALNLPIKKSPRLGAFFMDAGLSKQFSRLGKGLDVAHERGQQTEGEIKLFRVKPIGGRQHGAAGVGTDARLAAVDIDYRSLARLQLEIVSGRRQVLRGEVRAVE